MLNKRADKLELLRIAEAVALEKSIDKDLICKNLILRIFLIVSINISFMKNQRVI